jgi:hypothetical protein
VTAAIFGILSAVIAPSVRADDSVVYEVSSSDITAVDVEYTDIFGTNARHQVRPPWRIVVPTAIARSNDTIIRAKWPKEASKWVTVRIYYRGSLYCEKTRDTGNVACFGDTDYR